MAEPKIIAVLGATGAQGGGLVRAICADKSGEFKARALTRDPNSEKARALAALGAEVVKGDVDDVESMKAAFSGAYGVFGVTFFWEHFNPVLETSQAKARRSLRNTGQLRPCSPNVEPCTRCAASACAYRPAP